MTSNPSTAERIRSAEETISKAQGALDTAQKGLHAAEDVVTTAEKAGANPWAKASIAAVFVLIIAGIAMIVRGKQDSSG